MKNNKKIRVYFDYNIYEDYAKGKIQLNLTELRKYYSVYQSVALIEEYYKAEKNCNEDNKNNLNSTRLAMSDINYDKHMLCPGDTRIICESDTFEKRYSIVKKYDTQEYVAESAKHNYKIFKQLANEKKNNNSNMINYSNLSCEDIWNQKEIREYLEKFSVFLEEHNSECKLQLTKFYGIGARKTMKRLKKNYFLLKDMMFSEEVYPDILKLQTTIEFLNELLQGCGYNSDKKNTAVSGVYDISHMIYATYCDFFVTNDTRLAKRANAIYYYLGIGTKVVTFEEFSKLKDAICSG